MAYCFKIDRDPPAHDRSLTKRCFANEDGATAVEFGLVAVPFFALLWSIIETALAFWAQQILDNAVAQASRQLYTNAFAANYSTMSATYTSQGKTPPTQQAYFKTLICKNVIALVNCTKLDVDVKAISDGSFTDANSAFKIPITNGVYDASSYGYVAPTSNQICVVRASMEFPKFTSIGSPTVVLKDGNRLLLAATTFRAEPF